MSYAKPNRLSADASWFGRDPYSPPARLAADATWADLPAGTVQAVGFAAGEFGAAEARNEFHRASPVGINAPGIAAPHIANSARAVVASGRASTLAFGTAKAENFRRYLPVTMGVQTEFTAAFVQGGVKYVTPSGISAPGIQNPTVINTTADQTAQPSGFNALGVGAPWLDPRSIRPSGYVATAYGDQRAQWPPHPVGFDALRFGAVQIRDKDSYALPAGVPTPEIGFPRVRDRASKVLHAASPVSAVFGDIGVRLTRRTAAAQGFASLEVSTWASVTALNRFVAVTGFMATRPGAATIENATPNLSPAGFEAQRVGNAAAGYRHRAVMTTGLPAPFPQVSAPTLTKTPSFAPTGFDSLLIPGPWIDYGLRELGAPGLDAATFGDGAVALKRRLLSLDGGGVKTDIYGAVRVEHSVRGMIGSGFDSALCGVGHEISPAVRYVVPESIGRPAASRPMVGTTRHLGPIGYEATRWGARIIPESQSAYPHGFGTLFGLATTYNLKQQVRPQAITTYRQPEERWGRANAFNLVQYIEQRPVAGSGLEAPEWAQTWTGIANRNRRAPLQGFVASRFGYAQIDNNARQILPKGAAPQDPAQFYKAGMVSHRIRSLSIEGMEPPYISSWACAFNKAFPLKPAGAIATLFGAAGAENRSRELRRIGNFTTDTYGTPFIADAVRRLSLESRHAILPPRIDLPYVGLYTRYVEPPGAPAAGSGLASLSIVFRKITPRWLQVDRFGEPVVRNLTPELRARGYNMEEYGNTRVRLQWRPVSPTGSSMQIFGRTSIADSRRSIVVAGRNSVVVSDKLRVEKTGIPPMATQWVWLYVPDYDLAPGSEDPNGEHYGIRPPGTEQYGQVPAPALNLQFLLVEQPDPSTLFGAARITANSIRVPFGFHDYEAVSQPHVEHKHRRIYCDTSTDGAAFLELMPQPMGRPRLSPHTVYAGIESSSQARVNHPVPEGSPHIIDERRSGGADIQWGRAVVQNRNATIYASSVKWVHEDLDFVPPKPRVENERITVAPPGIRALRMGYPRIPGTAYVRFFEPFAAALYGRPAVTMPPDNRLAPAGVERPDLGEHRIELFNREIRPVGNLMQRLGNPRQNDSPYMWQGLRVGPLMPTIPDGIDSELLGDSWISHRVRGLDPEGFDAMRAEYDVEAFSQRMRVTRRTIAPDPLRVFSHSAEPGTALGTPDIRPGVHFIRPDGNADQFRKGAF